MRGLVALAVAAVLGSCGEPPLTEIFVCYAIDPALVSPSTETRICVIDDRGEVVTGCEEASRSELGSDGVTRSQGFVRADAERLTIALEGRVPWAGPAGTEMRDLEQSIDLAFAEGRVIDVALRLESACLDRFCPPDQSCVAGRCKPLGVPNERCHTDHGAEPDSFCVEGDPRLTRGCLAPGE